jgi:bifunctional DNase/RNase
VRVFGVSLDLASAQPVVILRTDSSTFLPIWVGHPEAAAIIGILQGMEAPRPLTHALVSQVIDELGARLDSVSIVRVDGTTFYAELNLIHDGDDIEIDARPSDAIALALRAGVPIYVNDEVLMASGASLGDDSTERTLDDFRSFLDDVSPSDFGNSGSPDASS